MAKLAFDTYYHIYNHANGNENLFRSDENYQYFLRQWAKYIEPVAMTYAYCLMPNHFHFLIRTKSEEDVKEQQQIQHLSGFENLTGVVSKQFSNLFNSYAKAYNKQHNRRGSLFMRPFKSKEITSENYLIAIVNYIHRNPVHHGFCEDYEDWPHSSYHAYLSDHPTKVRKEDVLGWFDGKDEFVNFHMEHKVLVDKSLFIDW